VDQTGGEHPGASLSWASTRVIGAYCHTNSQLADFLTTCRGPAIADVESASHPTYQIIRSFFDSTTAWATVGLDSTQATQSSGLLWQLLSNTGAQLAVSGIPTATSSVSSRALVSGPFSGFWSTDSLSGSLDTLHFNYAGRDYANDFSPRPGLFRIAYSKFGGPIIDTIYSSAAPPHGAWSVAPDSFISIYGRDLSSSTASAPYPWPLHISDTTVTIDGVACPLNYASDSQVNALVPPNFITGLHSLTLETSEGRHTLSLMIQPIVPFLFTGSGFVVAALHSNYQIVTPSNPAAAGETISLYGTGFGAYTQRGNLQVLNTTPQVLIDNLPATVTFAGRAPGYSGLDQINVQVPLGVHQGNVTIIGSSGGKDTNGAYLPIN
jgi:uncharacterized protein (TIGR03437 family)